VAKNSITVTLSIKAESSAVIMGKKINILTGEYFRRLASIRAKNLKKPASDRAETIMNIPNSKPMVSQLIKPMASFISKTLNRISSRAPANATTILLTLSVAIII